MAEVAAAINTTVYINIVTLWSYSWESQIYSNNYEALNSGGNCYNCIHTYARMLTFCVTEIICYIIINSAYHQYDITTVYTKVLSTILIKYAEGTFWSQSLWSIYNKYSSKYL